MSRATARDSAINGVVKMAVPRRKLWTLRESEIEEDVREREARKAARESEDDLVRRAVEKRFIRKDPPRRAKEH
jgi:hypothetical protein